MAVFKILRGKETTLPSTITDGYIYFCKDTKNYYIDYILDGTLTRSKIAAGYADKLRYTKGSTTVEIDPSTILTDSNYATKIGVATESKTGLMSADDKTKLDGIATNANKTVVDSALSSTSTNPVENKVVKAALDNKAGLSVATSTANGLMSSTDKSKLDGIAAGAEVNQNAYSKITVGTTEIAATSKTDNITIVAGNNVTLTPDASNKKYTISAKDTTYPTASASANGLMSKEDKAKLDGISAEANKYELPTASNTILGGIKVGTNLSIDTNGVLSAKDTTYDNATTTDAGLMSGADKKKLDGIATGATRVIVDTALSSTSENPVQNKAVKAALDGKSDTGHTHDYIPTSQKGTANGIAELGSDGKVPAAQLPSYVDDVLEYDTKARFPTTGETGKIYIDKTTNLTYRWGGSTYVEISQSLALGTTETTAAKGNHVHNAATTSENGFMSAVDKTKLDGIAANANNYSLPKASDSTLGGIKVGTNLSIDGNGVLSATDTTYEAATTTTDGLMSKSDKIKLDGIEEGANKTIVDSALSTSSTNPVQNKIVKAALDGKAASNHTHSAYVNQNAFSNVKVGSTTVAADTATDTLTLVAGTNVTITPDATNDKITIAATDTTYPVATQSADGLMSSTDKTKLDGVATGAQVNVIEGVTSNSLTVGSITSKKIQLDIEWIEF